MKSTWKCQLALVVLMHACLAHGRAGEALEIDAMPLSVARAEFLKLRPGARQFGLAKEPGDYIYAAAPNATAFGHPVASFGRGFVGQSGCAAMIGFAESPAGEAKALVARLAAAFRVKKGEHQYPRSQGTVRYLESDDAFAAITEVPVKDSPSVSIVLGVSLKHCSTQVERGRWQTRP